MLERLAKQPVTNRLASNPAVALLGPRQCGKTTLARSLGGVYYDLEQEGDRLRLDLEWNERSKGKELIILDEAQAWPEVFNRLRGAIDADRQRNGRFLLLGSVSPALMVHVSESLAGRLSLVELSPFLWPEVNGSARDRLWLCGGYPDSGVLRPGNFPQWAHDYLTVLTQRDLPAWGLAAKPQTTTRLLQMLAALNGQPWNASQVGQSMGLDAKTVGSYLDYLEGAFLIRRLASYQANVRKRLTKTPKVYWRDSGLLHATLNIESEQSLLNQPWVGTSWEGFVIEQIIDTLTTQGKRFSAYHFRTSDQYELDLVLDFGTELWAFEVKLTSSPNNGDMDRLNKTADLIKATRRFLVSKTTQTLIGGNAVSCGMDGFFEQTKTAF